MTDQEDMTENDDILDLTQEAPDDEPESSDEGGEGNSEGDDFRIELDGEAEEEEPDLVRTLRENLRDTQRKLKGYESVKPAPIEVGPKPTLEGCDYDEERFESEITGWHDRKRKAADQEGEQTRQQEAEQASYRKQLSNFETKLAVIQLAPEKKEAAVKTVVAALSVPLQTALVRYASNPAMVAIALGQNPAKLAKIAENDDPFLFMRAIWELENKIVVNRKKPPAPEAGSIVRSSASMTDTSGKTLKKLEDEARKTGDRTKLIDFKRKQNRKDKAA